MNMEINGKILCIRAAWSTRRADASEASSLGFDHGADIVAPPFALLLRLLADRYEVFFGHTFVEQMPQAACA